MSYCCEECFNDEYLKNIIRDNVTHGACDFCGSTGKYCIAVKELKDIFLPVMKLYTPVGDFMPTESIKNIDGHFIWEKLNDDWQLFELDYEKQEKLMRAMLSGHGSGSQFLDTFVENESEYWGIDIEHNDRLRKQWENFRDEIMHKNRYFPTKTIDIELLQGLLGFFSYTIDQDSILYRGRISHIGKKLNCVEMGKPPVEKSKDGRANPKGISYLYVASDIKTVIAEVRPSIGDKVTTGKFNVKEELHLVDLRDPGIESPFQYGNDLGHVLDHLHFMKILGNELSKPVNIKINDIEYIPTQFLCELIKKEGFDGVIYGSSVGSGYNVAIFDDAKVECLNTDLYVIESAEFKHTKIDDAT